MRRDNEAVKAKVKQRMRPPERPGAARISQRLGIGVATLYSWRQAWRLQGEVVPAAGKGSEGWPATDKFSVVLETTGINDSKISACCREWRLYRV